jgi:hypothetical protein
MQRLIVVAVAAVAGPIAGLSQAIAATSVEERLERLEQRQQQLEEELRAKEARIRELESQLGGKPGVAATTEPPGIAAPAATGEPAAASAAVTAEPGEIGGSFEPGKGFVLARTPMGEIDFSAFAYTRYLNQNELDETYTDAFGNTRDLDLRNDLQFQKAILYFKGWLLDPKLRYVLYTWTSNTSQGQDAQVVLAGYLNYTFTEKLSVGAGIGGLPTTRSTRGTWPRWLKVDNRTIADEFFRGSYTTGIWAAGKLAPGVKYKVMVGNNLSQLGVDGVQLDGNFNTISTAVWWMPTTGEFGPGEGFGDFEYHEELATSLGLHATRSREDAQSQPGLDDPENTQIRLSDGTGIFQPDVFGPGVRIQRATYEMAALDAGLKYRGYALEGEYFWRTVDDLQATGPLPVDDFWDHGFQLQGSAMLVPQTVQAYLSGSKIFGEYGDPWDFSAGLNWFPYKNQNLRVNGQLLYLDQSPVGYTSVPFIVGGDGFVWTLDLMLNF